MEFAARQFARRILLIHFALLLGVVGIVYFASREVYGRTKFEATEQAKSKQALLAGQTARGIEAFYSSIFHEMDLLRQADYDEGEEPAARATTRASAPRIDFERMFGLDGRINPANTAAQAFFAAVLGKQLDGRVVTLFGVNRDRMGRRGMTERATAIQEIIASDSRLTHREILARSQDWLRSVRTPQIGPYQEYDLDGERVGVNVVCVPSSSDKSPRLLVAAVPVARIKARFTNELNMTGTSTNAILCDEAGTIMIGGGGAMTGRDIGTLRDDRLRDIARKYVGRREGGVETLEAEYTLGGQQFPPGIMAVEPVWIAGTKWTLMVITPLADVDAVVNRVFKRAVFWAIFVVCSMTAILLSTAVQLIRARIRTERVRNDLLTRELTQAREIQLAWLPRQGVAMPMLDIAAVNQPANHISGDFYNWFELPDGRTVVTIGDVTGHGLSAAFLMATSQLLVHTTMLRLQDPGKTLAEVNKHLCTQVFNGQFVTMLICVLDLERGLIEVSSAGHYAPIIGHRGVFTPLPMDSQLVLGVEKDVRYPTDRFDLLGGSSLVLYTDGVIDAHDARGKRFDLRMLINTITGHADSAQGLVDTIVGRINQFRGTLDLPDDLTLVCVQTSGAPVLEGAEPVSV